jgi:hypothetical protein
MFPSACSDRVRVVRSHMHRYSSGYVDAWLSPTLSSEFCDTFVTQFVIRRSAPGRGRCLRDSAGSRVPGLGSRQVEASSLSAIAPVSSSTEKTLASHS